MANKPDDLAYTRKMAKVTHVSIGEAYTDTFAFEADARTFFAEVTATQTIIFASLHVREGRNYRLKAVHNNLEGLELD
ncbi:hypothetical protein V1279_003003 [Bradyrhizobium sp. AZCC 1610]|uniref:hypothetical protein n=1 Tax=Bradyrhizobium sp. AZCC 1610 TaxID=3117020 RepID=UPI002FF24F83